MRLDNEHTSAVRGSSVGSLVPVHPESVIEDPQTLRWIFPAGTLQLVGVPAVLPINLQGLIDDGTVRSLSVEPAAVRIQIAAEKSWRNEGARVRTALQKALSEPDRWQAPPDAVGDEGLQMAVRQVIDGEVGDYIRSHGGHVEMVRAQNDEVEVRLGGACSHCPASDITLTDRLEGGIRALYPALRGLTAQNEAGPAAGRRLLRMLPTRGR
ncbi:MAG: NifU family protein [Antricoccus sp.]